MKISTKLIQTMRWFGPSDLVPISYLKIAGAEGIATALNHVAPGDLWTISEILKRKSLVESYGLKWTVAESVHVHEEIKLRSVNCAKYISNFKATIRNLAKCGVNTVCYSFMPLLDWTRTDVAFRCEDGSLALALNWKDLAVFDIFVLRRPGAAEDYPHFRLDELKTYYLGLKTRKLQEITRNILSGLPGTRQSHSLRSVRSSHLKFSSITPSEFRSNLVHFLREVTPVAEKANVRLAIHPDDPAGSLFGIQRIVSTHEDIRFIFQQVDSAANGFTLCTGSFDADSVMNVLGLIKEFGDRIHFIHLRNIKKDEQGNFFESNYFEGDVDMKSVMMAIIDVMKKRNEPLPMRPDHGQLMLVEPNKARISPGYAAARGMKGLAELRGLEYALQY